MVDTPDSGPMCAPDRFDCICLLAAMVTTNHHMALADICVLISAMADACTASGSQHAPQHVRGVMLAGACGSEVDCFRIVALLFIRSAGRLLRSLCYRCSWWCWPWPLQAMLHLLRLCPHVTASADTGPVQLVSTNAVAMSLLLVRHACRGNGDLSHCMHASGYLRGRVQLNCIPM